jgi:hypothetical protein
MNSGFWRRLTISDLGLIILCLAGILVSWQLTRPEPNQQQVFIYKNNVLWGEYPLSKDRIIKIDEHNSVEIKDGKARMLYADCPDQRCMKMGFTQNVPIICLPNQVVIEIKNHEQERKFILQ